MAGRKKRKSPPNTKVERNKQIAREWEYGLLQRDIAVYFGISRSNVREILLRYFRLASTGDVYVPDGHECGQWQRTTRLTRDRLAPGENQLNLHMERCRGEEHFRALAIGRRYP